MIDPKASEIIFEELKRCYVELQNSRRFPVYFRRLFDEYIYKSQQLTEVMRKEYMKETGLNWSASDFSGWCVYTDILKLIRRATFHGVPLELDEFTLSVYPAVDFATDRKIIDLKKSRFNIRFIRGVSSISMPFSEEVATPRMGFPLKSPVSDVAHDLQNYVFPIKEFVSYQLQWKLLENGVRSATNRAGTIDCVLIVLKSFPVYVLYFKFYNDCLEKNTPKQNAWWIKPSLT